MKPRVSTKPVGQFALASILLVILALACGCANDAIKANEQAVQRNQVLLEQTQLDIARLKSQEGYTPPASTPGKPAACDRGVEATATRRAGDAYAAGDTAKALGYYQDALTACPTSSKAALNLARTNESMNNREAAIRFYRQAAASSDADARSIQDAQAALSRMGVN